MKNNLSQVKSKKGLLILESVEFSDIIEREVMKNNESSGKVNIPKSWIGKKVFVVLKEVKKNEY